MTGSTVMNVGQLPPPSTSKVTHYSIELLFEEAMQEAREKCGNLKAAVRIFLECKSYSGDWEKIYTGLSKSYIHTGLQPNKSYHYRLKVDNSTVKSDWSASTTASTTDAPFTGDDLHHAIRRHNLEKAQQILDSGQVHADAQNEKDWSGLVEAGMQAGQQDKFDDRMMTLLLEHGADVNRKDASGKTPLIHAASREKLDTVKFLCENGADVLVLDKSGMAAIHHAVDGGFVKIVEWMLDNSDKYGFDIEQMETSNGMTPLNRCANMTPDSKAYELAASLQLRGANMGSKSYNNLTPLLNAILRKKPKLVEFFLARGADIYEVNENGQTPIEIARSAGHVQIMRAFEDKVQQLKMLPKPKKKPTENNAVEVQRSQEIRIS